MENVCEKGEFAGVGFDLYQERPSTSPPAPFSVCLGSTCGALPLGWNRGEVWICLWCGDVSTEFYSSFIDHSFLYFTSQSSIYCGVKFLNLNMGPWVCRGVCLTWLALPKMRCWLSWFCYILSSCNTYDWGSQARFPFWVQWTFYNSIYVLQEVGFFTVKIWFAGL